ncbi:MAG TPA: alpha/beta hydrolase fold domain-containing protein [Solirubrobacteraceae bacterium]|nr:alpha/beta hydrolase fold domain-containing protein [Solirubrobacteraceae bacterium]
MRVIVVGGGIGGLAAGIALRNEGFETLVLERSDELTEIGAGIGLAANALRALDHLAATALIRERSIITLASEWLELDDGAHIFTQQFGSMVDKYGDTYYCSHRADLIESLATTLPADSVRVSAAVTGVSEAEDSATVTLEGGEQLQADLVVGADGLRSTVRAALFEEPKPRFTGYVTWRCLAPADLIPERFGAQITVWLGRGRHAMLYPIREGLYNFSGFVPAEEVHRETWSSSEDVDDLRRSFDGACADVLNLIDAVETALITPLYFRDPFDRWGSGRITLLGDAAHPAPPSAGQGASMALEDAVTLAECLKAGGAAALEGYVQRRMDRTRRMLVASRINLGLFNENDPDQARARNARLRGLQRLDPDGESTVGWLYSHDAVAVARAPVEVARPSANPLTRPEAREAFDLWRGALTIEDRSGLWRGERAGYARFMREHCAGGGDFDVELVKAGEVDALLVTPAESERSGPIVMHLHGGGFVFGSAEASVDLTARLAREIGGSGLTVDYRLAPEYPFPAALDDALSAYRWLRELHPEAPILLSGECAGGNLAVALAVSLRDAGDPLPQAIHVVSPLCDLTVTAPSIHSNAGSDPWLNRGALLALAGSYIAATEPDSQLVSPIHADLSGLPPLYIAAAAGESLRDDATRLADAAREAGVDVTLELIDDTVHSFVLFDNLAESRGVIAQASELLGCRPLSAAG